MATTRALVYPHPSDAKSVISGGMPGGLHPTAGLAHNWSLDYMAAGGTQVLAVERGVIWKLSGHNPKEGEVEPSIFGWNIYVMTRDGLMYFYTHIGERYVSVGEYVRKSQVIGKVGKWPQDPGRSHTHLGVSHPMGERASKRACLNVGGAPHVKGYVPL
jgi:murein DD-endopeptidase MepM/ murein hydrolase activator NlpD